MEEKITHEEMIELIESHGLHKHGVIVQEDVLFSISNQEICVVIDTAGCLQTSPFTILFYKEQVMAAIKKLS